MIDFITVTAATATATVATIIDQAHTIINVFSGGPIIIGENNAYIKAAENVVAGAAVSGHRAIALIDGIGIYADCTIASHAYLTRGISQSAVIAGSKILIANREIIEESTWNWIPGQPVFLGQGGLLRQPAPVSPALFILEVGLAVSPHRLDVNIQRPIFI